MGDVEKVGGTKEGDGRGEGEDDDDDDSSDTEVKLGAYLTLWTGKSAEARGLWELTDEGKRYQTWWAGEGRLEQDGGVECAGSGRVVLWGL